MSHASPGTLRFNCEKKAAPKSVGPAPACPESPTLSSEIGQEQGQRLQPEAAPPFHCSCPKDNGHSLWRAFVSGGGNWVEDFRRVCLEAKLGCAELEKEGEREREGAVWRSGKPPGGPEVSRVLSKSQIAPDSCPPHFSSHDWQDCGRWPKYGCPALNQFVTLVASKSPRTSGKLGRAWWLSSQPAPLPQDFQEGLIQKLGNSR